MQRVAILGNCGSGKSTLARALGERLSLPVVHLDPLFYGPGWTPGDPTIFRARVAAALAGDRWIVDGNFLDLVGDLTSPRADLIVWVHQPCMIATGRALRRCFDPLGRYRDDLPAGCRDTPSLEMLSDILTYDRRTRPAIERHLTTAAAGKTVRRLTGDGEVAAFLAGVAGCLD